MRKGSRHADAVAAASPCSHSSSNIILVSPTSATVTASGSVLGGSSSATACRRKRRPLLRRCVSAACPSPSPCQASYPSQQQQQRSHRRRKKNIRRDGRDKGFHSHGDAGSPTKAGSNTNSTNEVANTPSSSLWPPLPSGRRNSATATGSSESPGVPGLREPQLQPRQHHRRLATEESTGTVDDAAAKHRKVNEIFLVRKPRVLVALSEEAEKNKAGLCRLLRGNRSSSQPATAPLVTDNLSPPHEGPLSPARTRRTTRQSAKKLTPALSRRPTARQSGNRTRHRRRLSPAHPMVSSPAVSQASSIDDAGSDVATDQEGQTTHVSSQTGHSGAVATSEAPTRPSHRATNKQSRKSKGLHAGGYHPPAGLSPAAATVPPSVECDATMTSHLLHNATGAAIAASENGGTPATLMRLAEFPSGCEPVDDPCVVAACAIDPAVLHGVQVSITEAALASIPRTAVPAQQQQQQQQSENEKQLSRRGLRFGAAPFVPGMPVSLGGAIAPTSPVATVTAPSYHSAAAAAHTTILSRDVLQTAEVGDGDAVCSEAVHSPQSFLGSGSVSSARSPTLVASSNNHSHSSGGRMSGVSVFAMELAGTAASAQWTVTTTAPSQSPQQSLVGRDDIDGDGTHICLGFMPVRPPALAVVATASSSSAIELKNTTTDKPGMRRSALMVTNTATGARISPATMTTPSGSPTSAWNVGGGYGLQSRASGRGSGSSSLTAAAAATDTSPSGTHHNTGICSGKAPQSVVGREFPQAPFPTANLHQQLVTPLNRSVGGFPSTTPALPVVATAGTLQSVSSSIGSPQLGLQDSSFSRQQVGQQHLSQHTGHSPRLLRESDLDRVQHNRVAVSDVVAKDEGTLVDTLFADVNMIEDDESEPDGDDELSMCLGGECCIIKATLSPTTSADSSPFAVSSPNARASHPTGQQLQHRAGSVPNAARTARKEAAKQTFGGGYWYPSSPWTATDPTTRGGISGSGGTGTGMYRSGSDAKLSAAVPGTANMRSGSCTAVKRGLTTPPHPHRPFSASCASVASTVSLIDPKHPQADGAAYDMMGEDDEWEMNSSAYADSLDEAQIQWIEEQLRATENPAGYF